MTDEERKEAKRLAKEYVARISGDPDPLDETASMTRDFTAGYAAACEAKDNTFMQCPACNEAWRFGDGVDRALEAERARSAKLFYLLQSIERRARTASMGSSFADLMEVADWAADSLADHEGDVHEGSAKKTEPPTNVELKNLEAQLKAERVRSAKLRVELQHIIDHEWTASPTSSSAWKWINHFVDGARKALAENEVARD